MEKGNIVEIRIEDMSGEGQGIGKTAGGFVVFVPGAVAGDVVRAELTKVKKNYGFARLLDVLEESPDRTDEFDCEFFENGCGGCQFGRLRYGAQLALKESQVRSRLERIACLQDPVIRPIIGMDDEDNDGSGPYRYRNKAQFPVSTGGIITRKGGIVENLGDPAVGFFRAKSHEVVDCGDCYLQSLPAMAAADALRRFMEEDHITAWDPKWEKGLIRHLIVKTGFYTGEVMVVIVINGNGIPNVQKLVEMLDDAIYDVGYSLESVVVNIKKGEAGAGGGAGAGAGGKKRGSRSGGGSKAARRPKAGAGPDIMGDKNVVVAGKPVIIDRIGGLEFEISPMSFYQVNPVQMKRLYDKVREYCGFDTDAGQAGNAAAAEVQADGIMDGAGQQDNEDKPVVLDLYCGIGTIGLYCADAAKAVVGIESVKEAVIDANRNAVINNIVNVRYICGKAEEILPQYMKAAQSIESSENVDSAERTENTVNADGADNPGRIDPELAVLIHSAEIAILDPPRAGCRPELLEAVANSGVDRIVYISCDAATLARDIKLLGDLGYRFIEATPVDMFPWTGHVETVVLLSHKKPDGHINVKVEFGEGEGKVPLDNIAKRAETYKPKERVTYKMIKEYIEAKYGFKVHTAYIAEVKRDLGLPMYDAPNAVEELKQPRKHPTPEKVEAIKDALKHFEVI